MSDVRSSLRLTSVVVVSMSMLALTDLTAAAQVTQAVLRSEPAGLGGISSVESGLSAALVPRYGAMWGSWVVPVNGQSGAQAVAAFESMAKRRLDIVHEYHAWDDTWPTATEYSWAAGGRVIFANASARQRSGAVLTWTQIANGSQDSIIHALAARLKAFGRRLFLSFDEEPEERYHSNPSAYPLASFVAAYRHVHGLFAADGATNVVWVWNVTGYSGDESLYPQLYPGDSYADWIGWDPYNWFNCAVNTTNVWQSFDTVVAPFYNWVAAGHLSAGAAGKPYMLAEYGTVEHSGSPTKGQWFTNEISTLKNRPKIKAVVYFNQNKDCNWPVTTSSSSIAGFTSAGLSCYVNRALPSPPRSVAASPGNAAATVSWARAVSVCPVTAYTIVASPGGKRISVSGGVLSASFGGLTNGTSYTFQITTSSINGISGVSPKSAAVTPVGQVSPSPHPSARPSNPPAGVNPSATPTLDAGEQTVPSAFRNSSGWAAWLQANEYSVAIAVVVLLGACLRLLQILTSRRRRRR